jgi:excisionase family DNA binding protein
MDRFKKSRRTIYRWIKQGLRYTKVGGTLYFSPQDVDAWIQRQNATPALTHSHNGAPSTLSTPNALERTIIIGEPISTPPEYPSTPGHDLLLQRVDAHDQQLDVLEAFMKPVEQHPSYRKSSTPSTPEYTVPRKWKKSGTEFAVDMPDQLRAYPKAHGLQVREVIDQTLREFFAAHEAPLPVPAHGHQEVDHE